MQTRDSDTACLLFTRSTGNVPETPICTIQALPAADCAKFSYAVRQTNCGGYGCQTHIACGQVSNHYWYQMYLDELPVWGMVGEVTVDTHPSLFVCR